MAIWEITDDAFDIDNIDVGDTLTCSYTGSEVVLDLIPGVYRITAVGATGNIGYRPNQTTPSGQYAYVGSGGTAVGTLTTEDGILLYLNVGGLGAAAANTSATNTGGYNGGGSTTYYGGTGGGATSIAVRSGLLSSLSDHVDAILMVAGGGGGSTYYSSGYYGAGGAGGGTSGSAGQYKGSANTQYAGQGGTASSGGAAGTDSTRKGSAGTFGHGGNNTSSTSSYAASAGGGGLYGGGAASNQEAGGGGGSGYVSTAYLTDASTTAGTSSSSNTSNGSISISVVELYNYVKRAVTVNLSGGNFTSDTINGTSYVRDGSTVTYKFIPLSDADPVVVRRNNVDVSNELTYTSISNAISVTSTAQGATYGFNLNSRTGYYTSSNKGTAKSAAVARVNIEAAVKSTVTFTVINYAEQGYDFGVLGLLDTPLSTVYNTDTSGYWNGASADRNISTPQTVTYTVPVGSHFIDVKYVKDDATDSNNDTLQFKVAISPDSSYTTREYTYVATSILQDTDISIICGDVSNNFTIVASGDHAAVSPERETLYAGSDYQLTFTLTDTEDYRYSGVLDNNVDVTSAVVPPHVMPDPSYSVETVSGASYGFSLTSGYYQSTNTSNNTAALCKVVFDAPVRTRVTITYQNTGYTTYNFSMISELNVVLRTDYATDTSGMQMNGSSNFHSSDTELSFEIPAGESFITCKHKITSTGSGRTTGNLKFKVSMTPLESLDVPYYSYTLNNVQTVHNILILSTKIPEYTVDILPGPMGSVTPAGTQTVKEGATVIITCTPDTNYDLDSIYVNSVPQVFSGSTFTISDIQEDKNVFILFSSGETLLYSKDHAWISVTQLYKKTNGRWTSIAFAAAGDPYAKYIKRDLNN